VTFVALSRLDGTTHAVRAGLAARATVILVKTKVSKTGAGSGLVQEIRRYLDAVDAFRAEGREPRWLPEQPAVWTKRLEGG
jgi:hypothetical protein